MIYTTTAPGFASDKLKTWYSKMHKAIGNSENCGKPFECVLHQQLGVKYEDAKLV